MVFLKFLFEQETGNSPSKSPPTSFYREYDARCTWHKLNQEQLVSLKMLLLQLIKWKIKSQFSRLAGFLRNQSSSEIKGQERNWLQHFKEQGKFK